jgi:hypothetical protein
VPQGDGIRESKDSRARFRKFLFLTNERKEKKMSKTTIRKRLALIVVTTLVSGMFSVVSATSANAAVLHVAPGQSNPALGAQASDTTTYIATAANTSGAAVVATIAAGAVTESNARSTRLLAKDTTTGTAQTATALTSGVLSIYGYMTTSTAFVVTGGTFSSATGSSFTGSVAAATYGDPANKVFLAVGGNAAIAATAVAVLWTLPTSAGTYTLSKYTHGGTAASTLTLASPTLGTLTGQITVTVVASSAGGSYSATYSACYTKTSATSGVEAYLNGSSGTSADSTSRRANGQEWYIGFALNDAYAADLGYGNLVASATNGGIVSISANDGGASALSAGTGSTVVAFDTGENSQVRVDQPTAGAPLTTTVTITYNGTTVCTKTVTIAGAAASITISDVATVDLAGSDTTADWLNDTYTNGAASGRNGHYYILLRDSAGNIVNPATSSEFSMDPATTTTTVTALAVNSSVATSTSSTDPFRYSVGTFTCGPDAGSSDVKLRHTSAATGVTITSPAFTARCADDPYTYTASFDKAAYVQGDIATLTVKFLDRKGNAANSLDTPGAVTMVTPMLTAVTSTGSATMLPKADGTKTYTFTVGTPSGLTEGTYTAVIDFTSLTAVAATKQTPTYKLSTGFTDVSFTEVLKSVVALIASINKQIQALQKLILKR